MTPKYVIDTANGVVRIDYEGSAGVLDWYGTFLTILADREYRPGFNFLSDRRGCEPPNTDAVRVMIGFMKRNSEHFSGARWAVVGDQMAELGMTRMTQALASDGPVDVEFFWNADDALTWLLDQSFDHETP